MATKGSAKSKSAATMKQAKLSFASSKRTASTSNNEKTKKNTQTKVVSAPQKITTPESSSEDVDVDDVEVTSSEEEVVEQKKEVRVPPTAQTRTRKPAKEKASKPTSSVLQPKHSQDNVKRSDLDEKDPKWRQQYAITREKMGHMHPIHAEGQNKIHEILRVFDMSYEYGPCVGIGRLERWERAAELGLNPPPEIREILETKEGYEKTEYSQSVLYNQV